MDVEEFRVNAKKMVDYICDYMSNIGLYRVTPDIKPGYLRKLLPSEAPQQPEDWTTIMKDFHSKVMPGVTHWQHPRFHAYFPSGNSYPSILADMLSDTIACIGFSWAASPACTELETIVMDWLAKAIGLPDDFITSIEGSKGGGVIETSASECVLVSMLAARNQAYKYLRDIRGFSFPERSGPELICYCSSESHSCVEKAAKILMIRIRILDPDENGSLRGETLRVAMVRDVANGLFPFFVSAILGSTSSGAFDNLLELGPVCQSQKCTWLHVDAAYAGNAFICPELKKYLNGVKFIDSFNMNPNKWLLTNFDCSCLWVKNRSKLTSALVVDPLYLRHANADEAIDYRHWGIPLSRRFRSLKLWFVIRNYGLSGLQSYIRNHITLAKHFESLVRSDKRFEVVNDVRLGLVCFRLIQRDVVNETLLSSINASGKLHLTPSMVKGKYIIRFCLTAEHATREDVEFAWQFISDFASKVLDAFGLRAQALFRPPLTRQKSSIHSFTRSVSKEIYKRSQIRSHLYDGATPILVVDSDDENESNIKVSDNAKVSDDDALTSVGVYDDDVVTK